MNSAHPLEKVRTLVGSRKFSCIWSFVIVFVLFYVQSDAMLFSLNPRTRIIEFVVLFFVFVLCWLRCRILKIRILNFRDGLFVKTLILISLFLVSFVFNIGNTFNIHRYLIQISNIALAFVVVLSLDLGLVKKQFVIIVCIFSVLSLAFFIPYYFEEKTFSFFPVIENSAEYRFYFTGFAALLIRTRSGLVKRNYGIFREPGVYGVFLVAALLVVLFGKIRFKHKASKIMSFGVLLTTIFSTLSTTTIIASVILCFAKMFAINGSKVYKVMRVLLFSLFGVASLVILVYPDLLRPIPALYNIFGKFTFANESFVSRFFDTFATFCVFLVDPLFGVGFGGLHSHLSSIAGAFGFPTNGGINSLLQTFAVHGLAFGGLVTFSIYRCFLAVTKRRDIFLYLVLLSFLLCIFNEDICNSFFFFLIVLAGFSVNYPKSIYSKGIYYYVKI